MSALRQPKPVVGHDLRAIRERREKVEFERANDHRSPYQTVEQKQRRVRASRDRNNARAVFLDRLKGVEPAGPIHWQSFAYCWGVPVLMFKAGPYKLPSKHGERLQREYFATWPDATPRAVLRDLGLEEAEQWQIEAIWRGLQQARRRKAPGFVGFGTQGSMLGVTKEQRQRLGLRGIGAIDETPEEREAACAERRRERDRARSEARRRATGARPRFQSYSAVKPWEDFGMSRRTFERLSKDEREQMLDYALKSRGGNSSPLIPPKEVNRPADEAPPAKGVEGPAVEACPPSGAGGAEPPKGAEVIPFRRSTTPYGGLGAASSEGSEDSAPMVRVSAGPPQATSIDRWGVLAALNEAFPKDHWLLQDDFLGRFLKRPPSPHDGEKP
jgi:hypothetical protein